MHSPWSESPGSTAHCRQCLSNGRRSIARKRLAPNSPHKKSAVIGGFRGLDAVHLCPWPRLLAASEPDDALEAAPEHALAVEGHLRGVHRLLELRILHDRLADAVAI